MADSFVDLTWFPHGGESSRGAQLLLCVSLTALMAQLLSVELPDRTDSRRDGSMGKIVSSNFSELGKGLTWVEYEWRLNPSQDFPKHFL